MKDDNSIAFEKLFPFEYIGGGYFRKKGVAIGTSAEILHGAEAVRFIFNKLFKPPEMGRCCSCRKETPMDTVTCIHCGGGCIVEQQ